jgi:hypothetical protein
MSERDVPIEGHQLDNGLRIILSRNTTVPVVAVNVGYDVGSRHEQPGRTGLAHLFEHVERIELGRTHRCRRPSARAFAKWSRTTSSCLESVERHRQPNAVEDSAQIP